MSAKGAGTSVYSKNRAIRGRMGKITGDEKKEIMAIIRNKVKVSTLTKEQMQTLIQNELINMLRRNSTIARQAATMTKAADAEVAAVVASAPARQATEMKSSPPASPVGSEDDFSCHRISLGSSSDEEDMSMVVSMSDQEEDATF
jgi:hypothetical protein